MNNLLLKTKDYLFNYLNNGDASPEEKKYRFEHSLRVTHIGIELAKKEHANVKVVALGCLLHDIGKFDTLENIDHGRVSAKVAREFLKTLDLSQQEIDDICYAIAIHVDGKAGYEYPFILEAKIVSDSDNIDRFSAYRFHGMMTDITKNNDITQMQETVTKIINKFKHYRKEQILDTKSGNEWFSQQLDLGITYFENFLQQLNMTNSNFNL